MARSARLTSVRGVMRLILVLSPGLCEKRLVDKDAAKVPLARELERLGNIEMGIVQRRVADRRG